MCGAMMDNAVVDSEVSQFEEDIVPLPFTPAPEYGFFNPLDAAAGHIERFLDVGPGVQLRRGAEVAWG